MPICCGPAEDSMGITAVLPILRNCPSYETEGLQFQREGDSEALPLASRVLQSFSPLVL
jgi:hypothetical protein